MATPNPIQTSTLLLFLSQASSSLAWGQLQIPSHLAHFFSSVTEIQHPEGPKSQWPEINGFAQITWHIQKNTQGFSLLWFISLPLCSLCLFSCLSPKAQLSPTPSFRTEVQVGAGGNTSWTHWLKNSKHTESRSNKPQLLTPSWMLLATTALIKTHKDFLETNCSIEKEFKKKMFQQHIRNCHWSSFLH